MSDRAVVAARLVAHHRRNLGIEAVDTHRHVAQDVLVEAQAALEFAERLCRGIDVHEDIMALAVLLDAVGQRFQSPDLGLGHLSAPSLNQGFHLARQVLDLLGR